MEDEKTVMFNMNVEKFVDDEFTIYTKGPFRSKNGAVYDYKLEDSNGIDYCMISQMIDWGVITHKILKEGK